MEILYNLIASLIWLLLIVFGGKVLNSIRAHKLYNIFGTDLERGNLNAVYAQFSLIPIFDSKGINITHPYIKRIDSQAFGKFSIEKPVSGCEVRALKYMAELFGAEIKKSLTLKSDDELFTNFDCSYVAFGGPLSNIKSREAIYNEANNLIGFDNAVFSSRNSGEEIISLEKGYDYGLILKIHPVQFPGRVWIVCAGIGEWGTSGSSWYLCNKWKKLNEFAKKSNFAIIVKVKPGLDESAEAVIMIKDPADLK